jgi:hypothetical protein
VIGRPIAERERQRERDRVDDDHVGAGRDRRPRPARDEHRPAPERTDDEGLQQAGLGVASDDPDREEDRQHGAEEQGREHRQAEERRAHQDLLVDELAPDQALVLDLVEGEGDPEPVEDPEQHRQRADHREHPPAQALGEGEADDRARAVDRARRRCRPHCGSSPTASR